MYVTHRRTRIPNAYVVQNVEEMFDVHYKATLIIDVTFFFLVLLIRCSDQRNDYYAAAAHAST